MLKKMILSCVTVTAIGMGLASAVTPGEAHQFRHNSGIGFSFLFGSPGYYNNGYYNNGYYDNGYYDNGYYDGYYNNELYDNGYYGHYRHIKRHVSNRCHNAKVRYHHRIHQARICNGHVTKVY